MAARRVFHLQPCGEQPRWQEWGRHRGLDEFLRLGGSRLCPRFASDFFSLSPQRWKHLQWDAMGRVGWGCVCCCPGGSRSLFAKDWGTGRVLVVPLLPGGLAWGRLLAGKWDEMLRVGAPWAVSTQRARVRGKGTKGGEGSKGTRGGERSQPSLGLVLLWGVLPTPFWCCFWYRVGGWFGEGGHHAVLAPLGCVAGGCGCSTSCW